MKKAIVTGASGYIGINLLRVLSNENIKVYAIVRDASAEVTAKIENIPGVDIVHCSLENIDKLPDLIQDRDIDVCIHLAWEGSFGDARANYELQLANIKYTMNTVNAIAKMGVRRFVGAGTLAEKDVLNYHLVDGATPNAVSIYGIAKLGSQLMTKAECSRLGIEHVWCYLSNTYGVGNTTDNFVNMVCKKILKGERAAFTDGIQFYDFAYITDTVKAIYCASNKGKSNTAYYLGSGKARQLKEYIYLIRDAIDPTYPLHFGEIHYSGRSLEKADYSNEKLKADTGFEASVSFEEGIKHTAQWLRDQL